MKEFERPLEEDRLSQELQGEFIRQPLLSKKFLAKVFWFIIGLALGILWGGEAWGWECRNYCYRNPRSFGYHRALHRRAHQRAMEIRCWKKRRKYCGTTRSLYSKKPCQKGRRWRKNAYSHKPILRFHDRNRASSYSFLYQNFRCRRTSCSRMVGYRGYRMGRRCWR